MRLIYQWVMWGYFHLIRLAGCFYPKARKWIRGRKGWESSLQKALLHRGDRHLIWMHCASLGEFEQGRPLLEQLQADFSRVFVLLTFFSPSGYEIRKNYPHANAICYLPPDRPRQVNTFLNLSKPDLVIFVKYEFWFGYLHALRKRIIPTLLIAGLFRKDQLFFQPYGYWFSRQLNVFTHFFVQDADSQKLLHQAGFSNVTVAGDPRIDRVVSIAKNAGGIPKIKSFCGDHLILVAGSTHLPDMAILKDFLVSSLGQTLKYIIAPHEIDEDQLVRIESLIPVSHQRFSRWQPSEEVQVLVIDNIGMLASIYQYANLAFIGGGYGQGIHSVLEPMAFHLPTLFGPRYTKFAEAHWLIQNQCAQVIQQANQMEKAIEAFLAPSTSAEIGQKISGFLETNRGSSKQIFEWINSQWKP